MFALSVLERLVLVMIADGVDKCMSIALIVRMVQIG